jgi:hypothetical protein
VKEGGGGVEEEEEEEEGGGGGEEEEEEEEFCVTYLVCWRVGDTVKHSDLEDRKHIAI